MQPQSTAGPSVGARLTYTSPAGEQGYPGTLKATVTYALADDGNFTIHYGAVTDQPTALNLSNHLNFKLAWVGAPGGILGQVLTVHASRFLPPDRE